MRNLAVTGKNKLGDKWNSVPYLVVEKLKNLPVYRLKPESGMGSVRTLHRDHILPIGDEVRDLQLLHSQWIIWHHQRREHDLWKENREMD